MKKFLIFIACCLLTANLAHADWLPRVNSRVHTATVQVNGGALSYDENRATKGPLTTIADQFVSAPYALEQSLNTLLAKEAAKKGGSFLVGSLTGSINASIQPQASGVALLNLSGLSYQVLTKFSGNKYGVISYECVNTLTLSNIAITAQYGSTLGEMPSDKIGITGTPTSNTDCDSNLSWILPFVGDYIINKITTKLDQDVVNGAQALAGRITNDLFFGRDSNYLVGLNKLIPADKVVALPGGGTFPIGQYVQNNLAYLLANSQMTISINKGAIAKPVYGSHPPSDYVFGDVLSIAIVSPALSFSVVLKETAQVDWMWKCSIRNPAKVCEIP
ncbi:hypothetical protein [Undibacterium curvum]|uniref:hypothetical protein n=1 Tax=Undibacterium curvum TaxID=2762294 RepID=UPI003D0F21B2